MLMQASYTDAQASCMQHVTCICCAKQKSSTGCGVGYRGPRWIEADIDMDSSGVANHVVALVKGVTTSQTIDMAVVLQVRLCLLPHSLSSAFRDAFRDKSVGPSWPLKTSKYNE